MLISSVAATFALPVLPFPCLWSSTLTKLFFTTGRFNRLYHLLGTTVHIFQIIFFKDAFVMFGNDIPHSPCDSSIEPKEVWRWESKAGCQILKCCQFELMGSLKKKSVVTQTPFIQLPVHDFCCCWDLNRAVTKSSHHRPVHWLTQAFLACPHGYRQGAFRQPKPPGHPFRIFTGRIKWDLVGQSAPLGSTMGTRVPSRGFVWMLQRGRAPKLSKDPSAKE